MGAGVALLNTVTMATPNSHLICYFLRRSRNTRRMEHCRQGNRKAHRSGEVSGNQAQTAAYRLSSSLPLTKNATAEGNTETIFEKIFYGAVYQKKKKFNLAIFVGLSFCRGPSLNTNPVKLKASMKAVQGQSKTPRLSKSPESGHSSPELTLLSCRIQTTGMALEQEAISVSWIRFSLWAFREKLAHSLVEMALNSKSLPLLLSM